jgi:hypothetical protein
MAAAAPPDACASPVTEVWPELALKLAFLLKLVMTKSSLPSLCVLRVPPTVVLPATFAPDAAADALPDVPIDVPIPALLPACALAPPADTPAEPPTLPDTERLPAHAGDAITNKPDNAKMKLLFMVKFLVWLKEYSISLTLELNALITS